MGLEVEEEEEKEVEEEEEELDDVELGNIVRTSELLLLFSASSLFIDSTLIAAALPTTELSKTVFRWFSAGSSFGMATEGYAVTRAR